MRVHKHTHTHKIFPKSSNPQDEMVDLCITSCTSLT